MMKHLPGVFAPCVVTALKKTAIKWNLNQRLDVTGTSGQDKQWEGKFTSVITVCVGCIPGSILGGGASIISPVPHSISRTVFKPALPSTPPQFVLLPWIFHRILLLLCLLFGAGSVCFSSTVCPQQELQWSARLPACPPACHISLDALWATGPPHLNVLTPHTWLSHEQDCLNLQSFQSVALFVSPRD